MSDETKEWREMGGKTVVPEHVRRTQNALLKLKALIEQMVASDESQVAAVREQLHRMKHGGGS